MLKLIDLVERVLTSLPQLGHDTRTELNSATQDARDWVSKVEGTTPKTPEVPSL